MHILSSACTGIPENIGYSTNDNFYTLKTHDGRTFVMDNIKTTNLHEKKISCIRICTIQQLGTTVNLGEARVLECNEFLPFSPSYFYWCSRIRRERRTRRST